MPLVKTTISYEAEDFGRQEVSSFQREVEDIDATDFLWYCVKLAETMGYDCKSLQMITEDNKIISTDL